MSLLTETTEVPIVWLMMLAFLKVIISLQTDNEHFILFGQNLPKIKEIRLVYLLLE